MFILTPLFLLETAKSSGGSGNPDAVLTVPPEFNDSQRALIRYVLPKVEILSDSVAGKDFKN